MPYASNCAVGAALQREGPAGALRPLAFFSGKLSGSQLNWSLGEKECDAIVAAFLKGMVGWGTSATRSLRTTVGLKIGLQRSSLAQIVF